MTFHDSGTIVEGVGDDAIWALFLFTSIVLPLLGMMLFWFQSNRNLTIHPQSAEAVEDTRNRIHDLQANDNQTTNASTITDSPATNPLSSGRERTDRTCPICLSEAMFGIETNCGHLFCGQCIVTYWRHGNWLGAVRCPVCRQQVNILLQNFNDNERNIASESRNEIVQHINRYNRRFSGQPLEWMDYIRDLPTLLRHAMREVFTVSGLVWMFRLRIVVCFIAALLYFVSPLDLIPEAAFGIFGLLDDAFVLLIMGIYITIIYRRAVAQMAGE